MSHTQSRGYKKAPIDVPPFPFYYVGAITDFSDANIRATFVDQMASNVSGDTLQMTAGSGQFMYLISPISNGAISFLDLTGGGAIGGWDGGTWDNDDIPDETYGPRTIVLNWGAGDEDWYLYRTDFSNLGTKTWKLTYDRNQFV